LRLLVSAGALSGQLPVGAITNNPPDGQVWLQGYDGNPPTSGFSNAGLLRMGAPAETVDVSLIVTNGLVTNLPTGTIWVGTGVVPAPDFTIYADLLNQGAVVISNSVYFSKPAGVVNNAGLFTIMAAQSAAFIAGQVVFNQDDGTLTVDGAFYLWSGDFRYRGGTIIGAPYLIDSTLSFASTATNPATFVLTGRACALSGDVPTGCLVWLQANGAGGNTRLSTSGFVNDGNLRLDSDQGPYGTRVTVSDGVLVNGPTGVIEVNPGSGGSRVIEGLLLNRGSLVVRTNLELQSPTGLNTNEGAIHIEGGAFLNVSGRLLQTAGSIQLAGGTLSTFMLATNPVVVTNGTLLTTNLEVITLPTLFDLEGGLLSGSGMLASHLLNAGEVHLEAATGPLTISGNYTQAPVGLLAVDLEGLTPANQTSLLTVASNAYLSGSLAVRLTNTAALRRGDAFKLLKCDALAGAFQSNSLPVLPAPLRFALVSSADELDLRVALDFLATSQPRVLADGGFGFTASGLTAGKVILEASSNLLDWLPIQTNGPFTGTMELVDRDAARFGQRFYRAYRGE
jgi:hypothetical protein